MARVTAVLLLEQNRREAMVVSQQGAADGWSTAEFPHAELQLVLRGPLLLSNNCAFTLPRHRCR